MCAFFMKERDFMLERYEKVKEYVYSQYAKIYNEDLNYPPLPIQLVWTFPLHLLPWQEAQI